MKAADFDYELPPDRIAQEPATPRDASRLLVLDRETGAVAHRRFRDLPGELEPGDLLVLNDTKVLPARLRGRKNTGGRVQVLLLEADGSHDGHPVWRALVQGAKSLRPGTTLEFPMELRGLALSRVEEVWRIALIANGGDPMETILAVGEMPLPPYIRRDAADGRREADRDRYQTVYARVPGAVAAPTAGLHVTDELLAALAARGVGTASVTLHVGLGTFLPVRADQIEAHRMHEERFDVPVPAAEAIAAARSRGGRVVAVGTTVARTLESAANGRGGVTAGAGRTALFIRPGYAFRVVDALVTNFHLPRSTLLMLVCAFAGTAHALAAYGEAVRSGYRFYSYGDAMLVRTA